MGLPTARRLQRASECSHTLRCGAGIPFAQSAPRCWCRLRSCASSLIGLVADSAPIAISEIRLKSSSGGGQGLHLKRRNRNASLLKHATQAFLDEFSQRGFVSLGDSTGFFKDRVSNIDGCFHVASNITPRCVWQVAGSACSPAWRRCVSPAALNAADIGSVEC